MPAALPQLQRHTLAHPSPAAWQRLCEAAAAADRPALAFWAAADLPLVLARQPGILDPQALQLGLPLPLGWQRRRLSLCLSAQELARLDQFPSLQALLSGLAPAWLPHGQGLQALDQGLRALGLRARVFGSLGWQALTGLDYLRPGSDLDLWLPVAHAEQADAAAALLAAWPLARAPRLDGELVFADGSAVAWREWLRWRQGATPALLVKGLQSLRLHRDPAWLCQAGGPGAA